MKQKHIIFFECFRIMKHCSLFFFFLIVWFSCTQKNHEKLALTNQQIEALNFLGIDYTTAEIQPDGSILAEKDILIEPATLTEALNNQNANSENGVAYRQRAVPKSSAVSYLKTNSISYGITGEFTTEEKNAIRAGFAMWSMPVTNLVFVETMSSADIYVSLNNSLSGYGAANFPSGGLPGVGLGLNLERTRNDCSGDYSLCVRNLTTHEVGHTLGFIHNEMAGANHILGSPIEDSRSIMNAGLKGWIIEYGGLSGPGTNDVDMASALYPANGIALNITGIGVTPWSIDNDYCYFNIAYTQTLGRSYTAVVQVLKNGTVVSTYTKDIGVAETSVISTPKIFVGPSGQYQVRIFGRNYKGDFTQTVSSNTITFTK